jgi:peptidoglycan/LPS O-acetylase OafA/YrhL
MLSNNLNILRFIAASNVTYQHTYPLVFNIGYGVDFFANFVMPVRLFFLISGFLITKSYIKNPNIFQYVKNRLLRIFPGLFICLLFIVLIIGPLCTSLSLKEYFLSKKVWDYLFNNMFLNIDFILPGVFENNIYKNAVNGSLWTIPIEASCYLLVAFFGITSLIKNNKIIILLFLIIFCYYVMITIFAFPIPNLSPRFFKNINNVLCLMYFFIGMLFYLNFEKIKFNHKIGILSCVLYVTILCLDLKFNIRNNMVKLINEIIIFPYMIFYFAFFTNLKLKFLKNFGNKYDLSYGIYIYSFPIQQALMHFFNNQISFWHHFLLSYAVAIFLAFLSFKFVEKPCLDLKNKFIINKCI